MGAMIITRLRQVVVATHDRDATEAAFTGVLGLGPAFHDPGVAEFGLDNAVCPVSDVFVEVVSPKTDGSPGSGADSAAGRHLRRHGDSGYMVIFQVEDIEAARAHLDSLGVRRIWNSNHSAIGASHAHPSDVGGAIVSFDQPRPVASWLWGGPDWESRSSSAASGFAGIELAAHDPLALMERWSAVLNIEGDRQKLSFALPDGVVVQFRAPDTSGRVGLVGVRFSTTETRDVETAPPMSIGGVVFSTTAGRRGTK